ncbi:membrane protein [Legionella gratiana]|uniref:Membrane protein n=1 Tax=Legionella gratiana TaxID=45066 RepID=A0A378JDK4_9GAMM|nr:YdcF family protein [Legionella gratiana]KTD10898.1 membrane protein [Legionella gratiana]STX45872.1 membrane protein [Legionella gratiana]
MKIFIQVCIFFLILSAGIYSFLALYIIRNAEKDEKKHADVILVLSTKAYHGNKYNPCLVARVQHAVNLYKTDYAPKLLFSGGGNIINGKNEAQVMKEIALLLGVAEEDILLESASISTYENLLFSEKIVTAKQFNSIILVTEPFHSPRAILVAQKIGLPVSSSPAIQSICWQNSKYFSSYFLREPLAIIYYKMKNQL